MIKRKILIILIGYLTGIIMGLYFEKGIVLFFSGIILVATLINYGRIETKIDFKE